MLGEMLVKTLKLVIAAAALTSVAAVAMAQTATPPAAAPATPAAAPQADQPNALRGKAARLDANKDGVIDQQEFSDVSKLKEADTNNDGVLSSDELLAWVQKREAERKVERLTRMLDVDGDGKVTLAEIEAQKGKRFALMDRNNDGKLSQDEMRGDRRGGHHGDRGGDHGGKHWKKHDRHGDRKNAPMPDRT